MVTPELKCPTTNLTPSPANLLATETPCLGSDTSSPYSSVIFWLRMPPAALMSATPWSAPFLSCAPNAAFGPVIGPATPILICAEAVPANATARLAARLSVVIFLIALTPLMSSSSPASPWPGTVNRRIQFKPASRQKSPIIGVPVPGSPRPPAPGEGARAHVDPAILVHHLGGAGRAEAEKAECQTDREVDQIVVRRQQGSIEQGEVQEAHRGRQDQHVKSHVPPRPPGPRDGAAGEPGRPAAEHDCNEEKDPQRVLLIEQLREAHVAHGSTFWRPPSR